jgi:hypothetical protein
MYQHLKIVNGKNVGIWQLSQYCLYQDVTVITHHVKAFTMVHFIILGIMLWP